jgi:hypothetical protein
VHLYAGFLSRLFGLVSQKSREFFGLLSQKAGLKSLHVNAPLAAPNLCAFNALIATGNINERI